MNTKKYPDGYWKKSENITNFMTELKSKLGFTSDDDWYSINIEIIQQNGGKSVLATFKDSPQALLKAAFPKLILYPWRFKTKVPKNYWVSLDNQRCFIETEAKRLGFEKYEGFYKFTGKIIADCGAYGAIKKYKESIFFMLKTLYPEYNWLPWKFVQVPTSFKWKKQENIKEYCDWLYKTLGFTSNDDWYNLTQEEIKENCGAGLVFHFSSPIAILKFAYPEIQFEDHKFIRWKAESKLFKVFQNLTDDCKQQFIINDCKGKFNRNLPFDMASEKLKLILECDGDQHFQENRRFTKRKQIEIMNNDILKMKKAIDQGYRVIRIYQGDILKMKEDQLRNEILNFIEKRENIYYLASNAILYNQHKAKMTQ